MKTCSHCKESKPTEQFGRCASTSDGLHSWCKKCRSDKGRMYRVAAKGQTRTCTDCGQQFAQASTPSYCPLCLSRRSQAAYKRWAAANPDAARRRKKATSIKREFGITLAEYEAMHERQGGGCGICGATESKGAGRNLSVDHCHQTGAVRGLLCSGCNFALGQFGDRIDLLLKAVEYLSKAPANHPPPKAERCLTPQ